MNQIITYLKKTYHPLAILVYGSYADGSNNANSDFDALVISKDQKHHDVSFVGSIQLDVFVYPRSFFLGDVNYENFLQLFDSQVVFDPEGLGQELKDRVLNYLGSLPRKSPDEIESNIAWCRKMLLRANRKDAEGMFRWHWLLTDSLEIFCDAVGQFYFGPKKSLRWMAKEYPAAYDRYAKALFSLDYQAAREWVECLETLPPPVPVEV